MSVAQALTIAGSDSGGGAGIQADLKTFHECGVFGLSVVTAITAQNTLGVHAIHMVPVTMVQAQLRAIADDFHVKACKMGMLGTAAVIQCVVQALHDYNFGYCILDPVMMSKGNTPLLTPEAMELLKSQLIPLVDVLTPNIPEAEYLSGQPIRHVEDAYQAAQILQQLGAKTVIIKGGHYEGDQCCDVVCTPEQTFTLNAPRFHTPHTHGTGCTFSACLTAELAKGVTMAQAVHTAKAFITAAICHPLGIGHGHGPTNHWAYRQS